MSEGFDLRAYLGRIGYEGELAVDAATLGAIANHHARAITFENLDAFGGVVPKLDAASLMAKLVHGRRGGWCFEQNRLLQLGLEAIGFRTIGYAARVVWMAPPGAPLNPRSHMLLQVDLDEGPYAVDVGFGGLTLTGALRLELDVEQETPHEPFRFVAADDGDTILQVLLAGEWTSQYRAATYAPLLPVDYELPNWWLATNPASHFTQMFMAARPEVDRRHAFRNGTLTTYVVGGGEPEITTCTTVDDVRAIYRDVFDVDVPVDDDLDVKLAALLPVATTSS